MPRILCISPSDVLLSTRQLLLESDGHAVESIQRLPQIHALHEQQKFDLAVVGHDFAGDEKRQIAHAINTRFRGLPILEMCHHSPEIPGADFILSNSPGDLLVAIRDVLAGRRVRGFPG
jgi:DNA-binding NtrC family response regulator